jgi:hypothetical protein
MQLKTFNRLCSNWSYDMYDILFLKEIILYLCGSHTYDYVMTSFSQSDHLNKENDIFVCEWLNRFETSLENPSKSHIV